MEGRMDRYADIYIYRYSYLSIYLSTYLSIYLSIYLSVYLSVYLYGDAVNSSHRSNMHLSDIYLDLLKGEETISSNITTSYFQIRTNSSHSLNCSSVLHKESDSHFSTQDKNILCILEELKNNSGMENSSSKSRLDGYFCSNNVFNLRKRVSTEVKMKILEKGHD